MASRLQDVIQRGTAALRPAANTVAPGTLYYSSDTGITERSDGTTWETFADIATVGLPELHASTHESGGPDEITLDQNQVTGLITDLANKANVTHAPSHISGGSDPLTLTALAGFPGGTTNFLRADGTFAAPPGGAATPRIGSIELIIDGGGSVITTGLKAFLEVPFACTIQAVTLLGEQILNAAIVMDIWKVAYASYPPAAINTITASAKPTIPLSQIKSQDTTLTGWNKTINAGDVLGFNVDSVTLFKKMTISLKVQAT